MLKLINSLTKKKEEFIPLDPHIIKMYHCGPTVYWNQHIGNMRGMLMGDLVRRTLIYLGYNVRYVRNYTDFGHLTSDADEGEDKMEKASKRENLDPITIADKYIKQFEKDTKNLNILDPTVKARATDYLEEMIKIIVILLEKGFAYTTSKAVYFDVTKFPNYTALSGQNLDENISGAGFGKVNDENKKHPFDFALWFFKVGDHKNALQFWPSPFKSDLVNNGLGFPGWHIECSAMVRKELGKSIDIHFGGVEHIPVHHTNEIAQSESANGVKFVNYWLHNEHLTLNNSKISKSDGNFILLDELIEKGYDPMHLRYLLIGSHYRSKQNFSFEALDSARNAYKRLVANLIKLKNSNENSNTGNVIKVWNDKFIESLEDDVNVPQALSFVWDLLKSDEKSMDKYATIMEFDKVLGLGLAQAVLNEKKISVNDDILSKEIQDLISKREIARSNKDWNLADKIRDELKTKFKFEVVDKK